MNYNYFCTFAAKKQTTNMKLTDKLDISHQERNYLVVLILITACFALWGFANNVTNPMVGAFSRIFRISSLEASLVPIAFNMGYFCMAIPAALFIQRFSFKKGILMGLALYAIGALLFLPAKAVGEFYPFLLAYFILTCGLSFLETSCNPYVCQMGSERHSVQRLNAVQSFNALGTVIGMVVAMAVHRQLSPQTAEARLNMPLQQFNILKNYDLETLIRPYIYIVSVVLIILVLIAFIRFPNNEEHKEFHVSNTLKALWHHANYREGVIAEFFYVGAQVACWTYIIQYGTRLFMAEGMIEHEAIVLSQKYNTAALVCFAGGRFVCTWLMQWFSPSRMLSTLAIVGMAAVTGAIIFTDRNGLYCLIIVSACLSLMFTTIYATALLGTGEHSKIAGAGLIMAILGGSCFPPLQTLLIESGITLLGLPSTNVSFVIPLVCLGVVAWYGHRAYVRQSIARRR